MDSRDVDVVVLLGDIVAVNPAGVCGFLPHPEGRRDFGLRRILAAISYAEALVSDVEDDSTYLVWRNNRGQPRGISVAYKCMLFLVRIIMERGHVLTTAVDTTAHSI